MRRYSIEPRTRKCVKGYRFYHLQENIKNNYWTDSLENASQKVVHEAGGVLENKITDAVTKSNNDKIVKI